MTYHIISLKYKINYYIIIIIINNKIISWGLVLRFVLRKYNNR